MKPAPAAPQPITPELRAIAAGVAVRLDAIVTFLITIFARRLLREPSAPLITPLAQRLRRSVARFTALMAAIAAGHTPTPRTPRRTLAKRRVAKPASPGKAAASPAPASLVMPRRTGWLLVALTHEGAVCNGRLTALLAEPDVLALLAATPQAGRLLRPLCRMLAVPLPAALRLPRRARPRRVPPRLPSVSPFRPPATSPPPRPPVCPRAMARLQRMFDQIMHKPPDSPPALA